MISNINSSTVIIYFNAVLCTSNGIALCKKARFKMEYVRPSQIKQNMILSINISAMIFCLCYGDVCSGKDIIPSKFCVMVGPITWTWLTGVVT